MYYIPYNNINATDYMNVQFRLQKLERIVTPIMTLNNFELSTPVVNVEGLALDYFTKDNSGFMGNISVTFDDQPNKLTFSLGVAKLIDEKNKRKFKRNYIGKEITLEEIESNVEEFFNKALELYHSWGKLDLTEEDIPE